MEENIIFRLFGLILTAYIFLSIAAICKLRELRRIKEEASRRIKPSEYDLWSYLLGAQNELKIPKQYCLANETDRAVVARIIEDYKMKLSTAYFEDRFHPAKTKTEQTSISCFMLSLYDYFDRTKTHDIPGHQLEEFSLTYFKAYYITYLYCKNSPISNPSLFPNWKDYVEKYLISELDERTS